MGRRGRGRGARRRGGSTSSKELGNRIGEAGEPGGSHIPRRSLGLVVGDLGDVSGGLSFLDRLEASLGRDLGSGLDLTVSDPSPLSLDYTQVRNEKRLSK